MGEAARRKRAARLRAEGEQRRLAERGPQPAVTVRRGGAMSELDVGGEPVAFIGGGGEATPVEARPAGGTGAEAGGWGPSLARWRELAGLTHDQAARAFGVAPMTWYRWLRGVRVPHRRYQPELVRVLGAQDRALGEHAPR